MFPFIPFPLIAGIIAIAGYRYLAKRQPEYPNARVIAVFTLLGGGLGGLLVTFLMYLTVVMNPPHLVDDSLPQSFLYLSVLLGGSMGCVPAALCGVWLAKEQLTRSWESSLMAAGYGAVSGLLKYNNVACFCTDRRIIGGDFVSDGVAQGGITPFQAAFKSRIRQPETKNPLRKKPL